ncbi:PLP-dependent threonine dehydratase ['Osedax' symbiont bacterium Rs2_46_30_T18]|nr:PLP-dependent threonine dehydratase ['Osedax' symbiont bacterium Rs2_46_30_T18]
MPNPYIKKILKARVYDAAIETPLEQAKVLSKRIGNTVFFKREDLQPVYSFKVRGAYNKMAQLSDAERARGVITASAGNHAQGLAMSAKIMGVKAIIIMPTITPSIKVDNVVALGGEVVLFGSSFDAAKKHAEDLAAEHGYTYCPPFDDPDVIAGQGTIAMEILKQHSGPLDAIFVPVGGGGLIAGIAVYIKYLSPETKIIGVESSESACLKAALDAGERVILPHVGIFADGVAVAQIGKHPFAIAQQYVDQVITVNTDEICAALKDIFEDTRSICEPSGALAVAGLKKYVQQNNGLGETYIAINSGANMNFSRLRHIAERTDLGEKREALIAAQISEKPGSFRHFCKTLGERNITEFNYRYSDTEVANILVGVSTDPHGNEKQQLISDLISADIPVEDLSDNEIAKIHIRYMVGGHSQKPLQNELVFRFEFPEKPGALLKFLDTVGGRWNISMFHYRNHGSDFGRVLVAMQAEENEKTSIINFLDEVGYYYTEETHNKAFKLFLG